MRRPIAYIFASFAGGIFLGYYSGFMLGLSIILLLYFISSFINANYIRLNRRSFNSNLRIFIVIMLLGVSYFSLLDCLPQPIEKLDGKVVDLTGMVLNVEDRGEYLRMTFRANSWKSDETQGGGSTKIIVNLSLSAYDENDNNKDKISIITNLSGSIIQLKGKLSLPSAARNPGLFNYKLYLRSKGIIALVNAVESNVEVIGKRPAVFTLPTKVKLTLDSAIDEYMESETKALLMGILFGDKTMIDEDAYENFQRNGCAHILSVSGLHVGIIYAYVSKFFRNRRDYRRTLVVLSLLLFYAALAGFSASVVRAVTMIAIHIISKHLHRRYDMYCGISFSALLLLIFNPYYLFNLGFQLSYLAVFALAFGLPLTNSIINRLNEKRNFGGLSIFILKVFAPILVIQSVMAPLTAYNFFYFSLSSFFINLPIIALTGFLVPVGLFLTILCFVPWGELLLGPISILAELLIKTMVVLNQYTMDSGLSSFNTRAPSVGLLTLFYGLFFFLTSESFKIFWQKKEKRLILIAIVLITIISSLIPALMGEKNDRADIVFLDVGQGDCIHIRAPSGKNILIDGGGSREYDVGKKILMPYLLKNGVRKIDLALVTHLHQDHYGGIASLCRLMPVEKLGVYEGNILREKKLINDTGLDNKDFLYLARGNSIHIEKDIYIDVIYPDRQTEETYKEIMSNEQDENLTNLVIRLSYKGFNILVTGDMGFDGENMLMDLEPVSEYGGLANHILKVGHHGSRYSTGKDFLEKVNPKIAVIQVGKNNFGHPHPDVIEMLSKKGIMIFRNDKQGAVLFEIDGKDIRVRTML